METAGAQRVARTGVGHGRPEDLGQRLDLKGMVAYFTKVPD